jgi:putative ATPase subunit gpP of terminase
MAGQGKRIAYAQRLKAFELYSTGIKIRAIAQSLGITRQCVQNWKREDRWDTKLYRASVAQEFVTENTAAAILDAFKTRLRKRMAELESLCVSPDPKVKLAAIKTWFSITDLLEKRGTGNHGGGALELEDDLVGVSEPAGVAEHQQPAVERDEQLPRAIGVEPDQRAAEGSDGHEHAEPFPDDGSVDAAAEPGRL